MPDSRAINEALRRAREFHSRAVRAAPEPPQTQPAVPEKEAAAERRQSAAQSAPAAQQAVAPQAAAPQAHAAPLTLETLLQDKERTLLLALLVLLAGEETGADLLFALFYLLI